MTAQIETIVHVQANELSTGSSKFILIWCFMRDQKLWYSEKNIHTSVNLENAKLLLCFRSYIPKYLPSYNTYICIKVNNQIEFQYFQKLSFYPLHDYHMYIVR